MQYKKLMPRHEIKNKATIENGKGESSICPTSAE